MAENKKQHYLPRYALREFAEGDRVSAYRLGDKPLGRIPYRDQCQESYFYGKFSTKEDPFGELEGALAEILPNIVKTGQLPPLGSDEYEALWPSALIQSYRTRKDADMADIMRQQTWELLCKGVTVAGASKQTGLKVPDDLDPSRPFSDVMRWVKQHPGGQRLECIKESVLYGAELGVMLLQSSLPLVLPDAPVVFRNPIQKRTGIALSGFIAYWVINPYFSLMFYDDKHLKHKPFKTPPKLSEYDSQLLNRALIENGHKAVYAQPDFNWSPYTKFLRQQRKPLSSLTRVGPYNGEYGEGELHYQKVNLYTHEFLPKWLKVKAPSEVYRNPVWVQIVTAYFSLPLESRGELDEFFDNIESGMPLPCVPSPPLFRGPFKPDAEM